MQIGCIHGLNLSDDSFQTFKGNEKVDNFVSSIERTFISIPFWLKKRLELRRYKTNKIVKTSLDLR